MPPMIYRIKDDDEYVPKHYDLFGGLSRAEIRQRIEEDRAEIEIRQRIAEDPQRTTSLAGLAQPYNRWSPVEELLHHSAPADISKIVAQWTQPVADVIRRFKEESEKFDAAIGAAAEILGFELGDGSQYDDMYLDDVLERAEELRRTDQAIKDGRLTPAELISYLQRQGIATPRPTAETRTSGITVVKRDLVRVEIEPYPPQPDRAGWDFVFDWYYRAPHYLCKDGLKSISEMTTYSYGYVRTMHGHYVAQYGEQPMRVDDNVSYTSTAQGRKM